MCGPHPRRRAEHSATRTVVCRSIPRTCRSMDPTRNKDLVPANFQPGSVTTVWWLCERCGSSWRRSIAGRTATGSGCRACSSKERGKRTRTPGLGQSLLDTHAALLDEWDYELNETLSPTDLKASSSERVWWRCGVCNNSWKALIWARARKGHGCRKCAGRQTSIRRSTPKPGASLAELKPELIEYLWHRDKNENVDPRCLAPNSHTRVWWRCPVCTHEWQATPGNPACKPCGAKRTGAKLRSAKQGNSLTQKMPEIAAQWHPTLNGDLTPDRINAGTSNYYWWLCGNCGHEWKARPTNRIRQVFLCPACKTFVHGQLKVPTGGRL
jgi:predicted metal-binding protein